MANIVEGIEVLTSAHSKLIQAERLLALNIQVMQQLQLHVAEDIAAVEHELAAAQHVQAV